MAQMGGRPVTVAAISEKLSVSSRTILRELPVVETWLSDNDFQFDRKRGKGIAINESPENLALVIELLSVGTGSRSYSKDERRTRILGTLFFAYSPLKAYVFTSEYDISESTLYSDLDVLEAWLSDYSIKINRRPGIGIFMTGEEPNRRQAIANAVYEFFDVNRIPRLIEGLKEDGSEPAIPDHPLVPFFEKKILTFAAEAIRDIEEDLSVTYVDSSQISLINRISLAIYRMRTDRYLRTMPETSFSKDLPEYQAAIRLGAAIADAFDIEVPVEETAHLAVYLAASRVWTSSSKVNDPLKSINLRHIILSMVGIAERITDIPFRSDQTLIDDLAEHIAIMEKQINLDMIVGSSQASIIRETYPEIYSAVETACQVLREWIYPKDLKESDISFIAIHFAAAAERLSKKAGRVAVAVVCPLGIASSKMLAASLLRAFPEIEIRKITSAFSINEKQLRDEGIDVIISTAEISTSFPNIHVGKVLQAQDKMRIQNTLSEINRGRIQERMGRKSLGQASISFDNIRKIAGLGTEIVELVEHFRIVVPEGVTSVEGLMEIAGRSLSEDEEVSKELIRDFLERERISDTYVKEMGICLFHCVTDAIEHSRFIYIMLQEPVMTDNGLLKGAVAMTVPKTAGDDLFLEPVGKLSALLVEKPGFLKALLAGDATVGIRLVEEALVKYYQHEVTRLMEV